MCKTLDILNDFYFKHYWSFGLIWNKSWIYDQENQIKIAADHAEIVKYIAQVTKCLTWDITQAVVVVLDTTNPVGEFFIFSKFCM